MAVGALLPESEKIYEKERCITNSDHRVYVRPFLAGGPVARATGATGATRRRLREIRATVPGRELHRVSQRGDEDGRPEPRGLFNGRFHHSGSAAMGGGSEEDTDGPDAAQRHAASERGGNAGGHPMD